MNIVAQTSLRCPPGFLDTLRSVLSSPDALLVGEAAAEAASHDWGSHAHCAPLAVALPASPEEVQAVVRICVSFRVAFTPRGAGTGLEGGAVAYSGGIVLDTSLLKQIAVHPDLLQVVVGAGVTKMELGKALAAHSLLFGPDPASNPSLGGMASTSGSGMTTLRYGTTRENVVSLLVVTPQGELLRTRTPVRKSSTGLELTQLYIGAEGTLGVIVELTLRCFPAITHRTGAVLPFASVRTAASAVVLLLRARPASLLRLELLNREGVEATNALFKTALPAAPHLFLEFASDGHGAAAALSADADAAASIALLQSAGGGVPTAAAGDGLDALWEARRGCYLAAFKARGKSGERVLLTDVCVPLPQLAAVVAATEDEWRAAGVPCIICAHVADGNLHCMTPYTSDAEAVVVHTLEGALIDRALAAGGTVSGEHGVGIGKVHHCAKEHGPFHIDVQRRIKAALDPLNLANPGKMLPPVAKL